MKPVPHQLFTRSAALLGMVLLVGCGGATGSDGRPPVKPNTLLARVAPSQGSDAPLKTARISTKSGEIEILEPDGEVTTMQLDEAGGDAFVVSEADLLALNSNLELDLGGLVAPSLPPRQTLQEKMIEEFAARTKPALPTWQDGIELDPAIFIGSKVSVLNADGAGDLIDVTVNLREGVDDAVAFSYATCALAGWAKAEGTNFGRHVRTLQDERNGKLMMNAAFTVSETKPLGLRVMETESTLRECKERGIPAA